MGIDVPTPAEQDEHLRSIVADLLDYLNYELLLVDDDELRDLKGFGLGGEASRQQGGSRLLRGDPDT